MSIFCHFTLFFVFYNRGQLGKISVYQMFSVWYLCCVFVKGCFFSVYGCGNSEGMLWNYTCSNFLPIQTLDSNQIAHKAQLTYVIVFSLPLYCLAVVAGSAESHRAGFQVKEGSSSCSFWPAGALEVARLQIY